MDMKRVLVLVVVAMAQAGCGSELAPEPGETDPTAPPTETPGTPPVDGVPPTATGFPCDVHAVLQASCASCHAGRIYYGPNFDSRDDLFVEARDLFLVQSKPVEPGTFGAHMAVVLRNGTMPPYGAVQPSAAERELVIGWIEAGMPAGDCGTLIAAP
jgi:cytochrome c5